MTQNTYFYKDQNGQIRMGYTPFDMVVHILEDKMRYMLEWVSCSSYHDISESVGALSVTSFAQFFPGMRRHEIKAVAKDLQEFLGIRGFLEAQRAGKRRPVIGMKMQCPRMIPHRELRIKERAIRAGYMADDEGN